MIYSTIETLFGQMTGDTLRIVFTEAQRLAWAQDAVREACRRSGAVEIRAVIQSVADQQEYDLPSDCDCALRVTYDGKVMAPTLQSLLRSSNPSWQNYSGTPSMYYVDELNGKFGLYFKPAISSAIDPYEGEYGMPLYDANGDPVTGGEFGMIVDPSDASDITSEFGVGTIVGAVSDTYIEVFYQANAPEWGAADVPPIPQWSHGLILFWMLSKAYESEGPMQDLARSALWSMLAERQINRLAVRSKARLQKTFQRNHDGSLAYEPSVTDRFLDDATA